MGEPVRIIAAALVGLAWVTLCLAIAWHHRRRRRSMQRSAGRLRAAGVAGAPPVLVAHASQTGLAEQLAWRSAEALRAGGVAAEVVTLGAVDAGMLAAASRALFIVSTTGEGDAPDSAARFLARVMAEPDTDASHGTAGDAGAPGGLASLHYALLALGDRSYARFCGFGRALDGWLRRQHAVPLFDRIEVHDGDEAALRHWQQRLGLLGGESGSSGWSAPTYATWRLVHRRVLNPGSVGAPVFHVALEPIDAPLDWNAGDLVRIALPGVEPAPAQTPDAAAASDLPSAAYREYSIASLPADGAIELVVRQQRHPDGRLGAGSGWLTAQAPIGAPVRLAVHRNPAFAAPPDARPMILIGNGTGIAGLRAHLKARAALGRHRNWLLFGERSAAHDRLYGDEIDAWLAAGVLERADFAFSRDQPQRIYVQHRLRESAALLREWVAGGGAIYVCGSLEGMAGGVAAELEVALGAATLADLAAAGRYRRDVY